MTAAPGDLQAWAVARLGLEKQACRCMPVSGDASPRRYYRLMIAGATYIVVHAPPATEKNAQFLAVRELLERAGVAVPALHAADLERGFLLLGDLGDRLLASPAAQAATAEVGHHDQAVPARDRHQLLGGERAQLEGGVKYVTLNLLSSAVFLAAVGVLYGIAGTLNMAVLHERLAARPDIVRIGLNLLLLMALGGFAGLVGWDLPGIEVGIARNMVKVHKARFDRSLEERERVFGSARERLRAPHPRPGPGRPP